MDEVPELCVAGIWQRWSTAGRFGRRRSLVLRCLFWPEEEEESREREVWPAAWERIRPG